MSWCPSIHIIAQTFWTRYRLDREVWQWRSLRWNMPSSQQLWSAWRKPLLCRRCTSGSRWAPTTTKGLPWTLNQLSSWRWKMLTFLDQRSVSVVRSMCSGWSFTNLRGFAAALRQVPLRGCLLECHVTIGLEDAQVLFYKEDGALMFVRNYPLTDHLSSSTLNCEVKCSLIETGRASHNSVVSLHWAIGMPRINPRTLMWTPRRRVLRRRPAAGH